jgi:hypothetical protein
MIFGSVPHGTPGKIVPFHRAGKSLALGSTSHVNLISRYKDVHIYTLSNFILINILHPKFPDETQRLYIGLLKVTL